MAKLSLIGELRRLLLDLFTTNAQLQIFIGDWYDQLEVAIDFNKAQKITFNQAAKMLKNYVDDEFFDLLTREQGGPANKKRIEEVREIWFPSSSANTVTVQTPRVAGQPFIDRSDIRNLAQDFLAGGGQRVTLLTGGEGSGKSHCKYLFTHLEATTELRSWVFDFETWSVDGQRVTVEVLADELASQMGLSIAKFKDVDSQNSWRSLKWMEAFGRETRNLQETWCLFFDSIHKVKIPGETIEFIECLAAYVNTYQAIRIRIILSGLSAEKIDDVQLRKVSQERSMEGFTRSDAESWIDAVVSMDNLQLRKPDLATELDRLFNGAPRLEPPEKATTDLIDILTRVSESTP